MAAAQPNGGSSQAERQSRVREIVEDCLRRRAAGESLDALELLGRHPQYPELAEELRKLALVRRAAARAAASSVGSTVGDELGQSSVSFELAEATNPPNRIEASTPASDAIPGYRLGRRIGCGSQGIVFEAVNLTSGRRVAVKLMLDGQFATPELRSRFLRGVRLATKLPNHSGIAQILHAETTAEGRVYCVMELAEGESLHQFMQSHRLNLREALEIAARICDAVQHAHDYGVLHRDLKPSNIVISSSDSPSISADRAIHPRSPATMYQPRILDFGLACPAEKTPDSRSLTAGLIGTIQYMAPEQAAERPELIDARTDVYALGVILFEVLTGKLPYRVSGHTADALHNIISTPPASARAMWTAEAGVRRAANRRGCPLDSDVCTILERALAKERERRYASPGALRDDIVRYLHGDAIHAKRDKAAYRAWKWVRQNRRAVIIAGVCLGLGTIATVAEVNRSATETRAVRARWVSVLQHAHARDDSPDEPAPEVRAAIEGIWKLLNDGRAEQREVDALAAFSVRQRVAERKIIAAADRRVENGRIRVLRDIGWVPRGFRVDASGVVWLDGERETVVDGQGSRSVRFGDIAEGRRTITGVSRVAFLRESPEGETIELGRAECAAVPFHFLATAEAPAGYPVRISDSAFNDSLRNTFHCRAAFVTRTPASQGRPFTERLRIEFVLPRPALDVAFRVRIAAEECPFEWIANVAVNRSPTGVPIVPREFGNSLEVSQDGDLWRFCIEVPGYLVDGQCIPTEMTGMKLAVSITSSDLVARHYLSSDEFAAVDAGCSAVILDGRSPVHSAAAALYYEMIESGLTPIQAKTALAERADVAADVLHAAIAMAEEASSPERLAMQALGSARKRGRPAAEYERALTLAGAAAALVPEERLAHLALGIAHYRLGQYEAAVTAFAAARYINAYESAEHIAFEAMAEHQQGNKEAALAGLGRLRTLMAGDLLYQLSGEVALREAEGLIEGSP